MAEEPTNKERVAFIREVLKDQSELEHHLRLTGGDTTVSYIWALRKILIYLDHPQRYR